MSNVIKCAPGKEILEIFERFQDILESDEGCFTYCMLKNLGVIDETNRNLNEQDYKTYLDEIKWPKAETTLSKCRQYYDKSNCSSAAIWYKCTKFILY